MEPVRWRQHAPDASLSKAPHNYLLEHLATFSGISKQGSLLSPEEGMRQLRQMALTQGHWVLRVRLLIKSQSLVILDATSGEEMEMISVDMVRQLTAFMNPSGSGKDSFSNVLLFTTVDSTSPQNVTEMHIFQCLDESAQAIVDDINSAKSNRQTRDYPQQNKQQVEMQQRAQEYEAAAKRTANAIGAFDPTSRPGQLRKNLQSGGGSDSSQHIMSGVELLNHCFDDIEQFMNQLQKVADAYKDLEFRRGGGKKDQFAGGGMITLRVRNPSQQAFVDIFQKFKLSFNLLAKLKPYIHDPNAPELVHFLFTPLGLVVEASNDQRHGQGGVASTVISPLLTAETHELLHNCLTSKEMELYRRLGESWTVSRNSWHGYVPPYVPRFYDGWNPPMEWLDDQPHQFGAIDQRPTEAQVAYQSNSSAAPQRSLDYLAPSDVYAMPNKQIIKTRTSPAGSLVNGDDGYGDRSFLRDLLSKNALVYQVTQSRKSDKKQELNIEKSEILEVLENNRNWWKVRNSKGQTGYVPNTLLQPYSLSS